MKNIVIFPRDWVRIHPYKYSGPVDAYYAELANRIYNILGETTLIYSFENDQAEQVSLRLTAYFEDVLSGLNIWRTFILYYKKLYGKYLPFYETGDNYYDDEVNLEDVRFLLWHYTQYYHGHRKSTFVNPDNPEIEETARRIYQLFYDEWTTAPENERMQQLFSSHTRYQTEDDYCELLFWFHYSCYLFPDANDEMTEMVKDFLRLNPEADRTETILTLHETLAYLGKTSFEELTSPEWLLHLLPADHPDYPLFRKQAEMARSQAETLYTDPDNPEEKQLEYNLFMRETNGRLLVYFRQKRELKDFLAQCPELQPERIKEIYQTAPNSQFAAYATPRQGILLLTEDVACIHDADNPFYDRTEAEKQALSFFISPHCSLYLVGKMVENNWLDDACTVSLTSPERGKAIVQENWEFLCSYFLKSSYREALKEADGLP